VESEKVLQDLPNPKCKFHHRQPQMQAGLVQWHYIQDHEPEIEKNKFNKA
jgi:hypothetical protein